MKKRMLITTIVMVLVVAIALTTSSLAWFTMSATVEISEVSFGAAAYTGSQLSVAELDRGNWGASANIGTGVTFDPSQGEPTVDNINLGGAGTWDVITFDDDTFFKSSSVETTGAGNQTSNQKVKMIENDDAVFIGGFNVRNDGTGSATVKIDATLNVGRANIINPDDSETINGDESYLYGTPNATAMATWKEDASFPYNEYMDNDDDRTGYGYFTGAGAVEANFTVQNADKALAGGLRIAVFTKPWVYTVATGTYSTDGVLTREGIYSFTNYSVVWGSNGWVVDTTAGDDNDLYVTLPTAGSVYSMNENLAAEGCYVGYTDEEETVLAEGIAKYTLTARGGNTLPQLSKVLLGTNFTDAGTRAGIEVVVVVWMDGWDEESVPAAGAGRVSISYKLSDVVA